MIAATIKKREDLLRPQIDEINGRLRFLEMRAAQSLPSGSLA